MIPSGFWTLDTHSKHDVPDFSVHVERMPAVALAWLTPARIRAEV